MGVIFIHCMKENEKKPKLNVKQIELESIFSSNHHHIHGVVVW